MLIKAGSFDSNGNPIIKVTLSGVFNNPPQELSPIIDTGFSGFLSMPLLTAFPVGLPLFGTTTVTLADGSTATKLTALGTLEIGGMKKVGVIILEENATDPLLGMDFLRTFELSLIVTKDSVGVFDQEAINRAGQQAIRTEAPPHAQVDQPPTS